MKKSFEELFNQGTQLLHRGKTKAAAEKLEIAYSLDPDHEDVALNLSGAYILKGQFKLAVPILEKLVADDRANASVFTNLGAAYLGNPILAREEDQLKAIGAFEQALEYNPVAPSVAYNIGLIYRDQSNFDLAEYWFDRAIQANPADEDARNQLAKMKTFREKSLHKEDKRSDDGSKIVK